MSFSTNPVDTSDGGTTVFVYALLGVTVCMLLAPVAWLKGNEYIRTCAMMGVSPSGLGVAGRWIGIIGTVFNAAAFLFVAFMWTR